jgi:NADPH:quinone reductase-like Zn-dependent oxidoreductase
MRAVQFDSYGGPDVLHIAEVERPEALAGTVLVKVKACSINPFDYKVREGLMEGMIPVEFPSGQGSDVAGVIEQVGEGVHGWNVGDEVLGAASARASQAEYALANPAKLARKPAALSWETAGAVNTVGATAWAMVAAVDVKAADTVLVSGASGGVGSLACQIAIEIGAKVIGVASEGNHQWLQAHGVIPVAYGETLQQDTVAITDHVDAVLDAHGGGYVELGIELGVAPERIDTVADHAAAKRFEGVKVEGSAAAPMPQALQELAEKLATGEFELRIDRVLPLDEVQEAYELLEDGHPQGKVVLVP